jgi:hypothetical protein
MSDEMNLHDRAEALRKEQMEVQQRLQHVEDFAAVLGLLHREQAIPIEIKAVTYAIRARDLRKRREDEERITAERKERNTKLRARIAEIQTQLESEKNGAARDKLGRERDALADQIRWG